MKNDKRKDFVNNYRVSINSSRYTTKKGNTQEYVNRVSEHPELINNISTRLANKGIAISLAALLVVSGVSIFAHKNFNNKSNLVSTENITMNKHDLEQLGIDYEDYQELEALKNALNSEAETSTLEDYREKLVRLSENIGKSKVAFCLQGIDTDRINFINNQSTNLSPAWQAVVIRDESAKYQDYDATGIGYMDYACSSLPDSKHTIDKNISDYISFIASLQSRKNLTVATIKDAINTIETFSTYNIQFIDGNLEANKNIIQKAVDNLESEIDER